MSLYITALASGSNGNCYYVGNEKEAILVDAGISCREMERRMHRLGLCPQKLKAIFISHEHTDHIRGLTSIVKKFSLPVYITSDTLRFGRIFLEKDHIRSFNEVEPVFIGALKVTAFPKIHDAADPYSFIVSYNEIKVGVFTDIGKPCERLVSHFSQCQAVFLESNYDDTMLDKGNYPFYLKNRIRGGKGHLSNHQALELFIHHRSPSLSHLFLSHLSKNNNCPVLVGELFNAHAGETRIIVTSREKETGVFELSLHGQPARSETEQLAFTF